MAELIAGRATCARRKVGCILVDARGRILATGYNGVAAGRVHCIDKACPGAGLPSGQGLDLCEAIHAEQNAILLLQDPWSVHTCYVSCTPCLSCIKLLLGTSCHRIVALARYAVAHSSAEQWWIEAGRTVEYPNRAPEEALWAPGEGLPWTEGEKPRSDPPVRSDTPDFPYGGTA